MRIERWALAGVAFGVMLGAPGLGAQGTVVGTFRWQLQPFCNAVTVTVTQQGAVYTLDGFDDQCGQPVRAPLVGLAAPNPDGSIGLGFHIVTVPGGRSVHVDARISLATASGTWTDSAGNAGTFALGGTAAGSPRPLPTIPGAQIAPGSITASQLAPGVIGTVAQARVTGICANGQALRGINPDGSVACTDVVSTVDPGLSTTFRGFSSSLAVAPDGVPVISHTDTALNLRLTRCGNPACSSGNSTRTLEPIGQPVSSLAIGSDGLPVVAFKAAGGGLRVIHCGNLSCSSRSGTTVAPDGGDDPALAIGADGLAVISHYHPPTQSLRVTRCNDVACTSAATVTADDPANDVGRQSTIAIGTDGLPAIAHRDTTADALRVTHCGTVSCGSGNVSTNVYDVPENVGLAPSIVIGRDGVPLISHLDGTNGRLLVTHCRNLLCAPGPTLSAATTVAVDPGADAGVNSSAAIGIDGLPIIAHFDVDAFALRVTHCGNVTCSAGNTSTLVDAPVNAVGADPSLAIGADGFPVISHRDLSAGALKVAKCGTVTCQ
jgi:hypothetical protein